MESRARKIGATHIRELEKLGGGIARFGVNFAVCGVEGDVILLCEGGAYASSPSLLKDVTEQVLDREGKGTCAPDGDPPIWRFGDESTVLAAPLRTCSCSCEGTEACGVALIDLGGPAPGGLPVSHGANASHGSDDYFSEMLRLLVGNYRVSVKTDEQIEKVGTELAQTYEELVLLHKLGTNMRVTEDDANFLQMACDNLTEIVLVEGIAVLVEKSVDGEQRLVLAAGSGLIDIDDHTAALLHSRLAVELDSGKEALLDSEVGSAFKYDWPENIDNILAVPLCGKEKGEARSSGEVLSGTSMMGLMVAINRIDKPDFDSIDINLFNSVASSCAVFIENGRLFSDLKDLFIGSLKALTSSIDAKDQYTRGHSERVAIISHWIAERLSEQEPLDPEQIHRVYLAGLLHDIGKIGVDESVLLKCGRLTDEERECIMKHPCVGAGILREIKQMHDIVPGVLCHHERVDGRGYPDGLSGDDVPLLGRIVGLADSFDAMTSKRIYRDAMTVEAALEEIERGLGTQFDERIGRVFLESDIARLWEILQGGPSLWGMYETGSISQYGATAVGTLIR